MTSVTTNTMSTNTLEESRSRANSKRKASSTYKPPQAGKPTPRVSSSALSTEEDQAHTRTQLSLIANSARTPFEKRVWTALCHIPRGRFTTYGLLSAHLGTSPRAVGNALRRNPFAPGVPCHRVVATGGRLGGFKGKWPKDGEGITLDEKRGLLRGEGVKLDEEAQKVLGSPWAFK